MTTSISNDDRTLQLDTYWPYLVTVLSDRIARRTSRIVKDKGLNLSQWRVMAAIADAPGRTSVEVTAITPMDKGIVSRATKALLSLGYVRRQASDSDGRISHLYLTDTGHALYQSLIGEIDTVLDDADFQLSDETKSRFSAQLAELIRVIPDLR